LKSGKYGTGSVSQYALVGETFLISKPKNLSFVEASSIPLVALTAIQMFDKVPGGVEGKTVFVPAGRKRSYPFSLLDQELKCYREVSGVGSVAAQMAKNVYGAGKVITTVSTKKVSMVDDLLGKGVVDETIDYTKANPGKTIPGHSIDVMMDSVGASFSSVLTFSNISSSATDDFCRYPFSKEVA
jgi:NADPH:quinone reductase-like Zn-dependent oxidoreductase